MKRTGKGVKRKPVLFTGEKKEKVLSMSIKEGLESGISKGNLMKIKAKIRGGKVLNGNLGSIKKIMGYINKQEERIKIY